MNNLQIWAATGLLAITAQAHALSLFSDMLSIEGGTFEMGSPRFEKGRDDDELMHSVKVADFYLAKHEVTLGEFREFIEETGYTTDAENNAGGDMGCYSEKPNAIHEEKKFGWVAGRSWRDPGFPQKDNHPVVCVSWNDAMAYVEWKRLDSGKPYRLPTEAEWEYAARGGKTTARFWGQKPEQACGYANVFDNTAKAKLDNAIYSWDHHACEDGHAYTAPVGSYSANPYGLKDMLGNVWEWTCSLYGEYDSGQAEMMKKIMEASGQQGGDTVSLGLESICGNPGTIVNLSLFGKKPSADA